MSFFLHRVVHLLLVHMGAGLLPCEAAQPVAYQHLSYQHDFEKRDDRADEAYHGLHGAPAIRQRNNLKWQGGLLHSMAALLL